MSSSWPEGPTQQAVEWLRVFAESWRDTDVPEVKADLVHAIYLPGALAAPRAGCQA
jgi:hypothetical protein